MTYSRDAFEMIDSLFFDGQIEYVRCAICQLCWLQPMNVNARAYMYYTYVRTNSLCVCVCARSVFELVIAHYASSVVVEFYTYTHTMYMHTFTLIIRSVLAVSDSALYLYLIVNIHLSNVFRILINISRSNGSYLSKIFLRSLISNFHVHFEYIRGMDIY